MLDPIARWTPTFQPMRVSQPAATVAGMVDRVTLGNPASPLSGASLAAVAAAGMPPSAAGAASLDGLRILLGLQGQGFHLQHKRRFWIPLLMHRRIEKTADEFLKDLEEGSTRLEISNDKHAPVAVRGKDDLRALDAFYLKASTTLVPQPALAGAVRAMADGGCRFFHKEEDVGPYGAWKALCAAKVKPVETYKTGYQTLASAQDASRIRFFEVDGVADGLDHPQEAMALKALAGKGAKFWTNSEYQYNYRNGSGAYHDLFQGEKPPDSIQAGTDHPLVRFTAKDLASPAQCVSAYDNALADLKKLEGIGLQSSAAAAYYLEMARPVGGETLDERCGWLKQLLDVTPNRPEQAFEAYKFLRDNLRSGDTMTAAITDFLPLRPCVDDYCTRHACDAFLMLRDKMDESLPGRETPEEKGKLFVELFKLTRNAGSSSDVWKKLEGTAPRAERVAAFATLHAAESSYTEHALNDYGAITSAHKPGETLTQVVAEFMTLRPLVRKYDYDSTRNAFNFIRNELDTALAGSWAHDEKKAMYVTLLEMLGKHESAKQWLFKLAGEGTPPTDLPQRIETLKALTQAGEGGIDSANQALSTILPLVRGGETLAAAAEDYVALRKPLPEYHVSDATAAFTFVRKDLASALP
ncbi:MAG: hypothetical protein FJX76_23115, partial [Armatimonadetes bacterium]|nr:hypothetical protein [Armatimonadota bacterium]